MSWIPPDLVWYKQEPLWRGPFQLCQPGKEEQLSKMEKIFCPKDKSFHMALAILVHFVLYSMFNTSEAPNPNSQSLVFQFWRNFQMIFGWITWLFHLFNLLQLFFLNDSRQKKCWMRLTMIKKPDKAAHQQTWGHLFIYQFRWVAFQLGQPKGCAFEK